MILRATERMSFESVVVHPKVKDSCSATVHINTQCTQLRSTDRSNTLVVGMHNGVISLPECSVVESCRVCAADVFRVSFSASFSCVAVLPPYFHLWRARLEDLYDYLLAAGRSHERFEIWVIDTVYRKKFPQTPADAVVALHCSTNAQDQPLRRFFVFDMRDSFAQNFGGWCGRMVFPARHPRAFGPLEVVVLAERGGPCSMYHGRFIRSFLQESGVPVLGDIRYLSDRSDPLKTQEKLRERPPNACPLLFFATTHESRVGASFAETVNRTLARVRNAILVPVVDCKFPFVFECRGVDDCSLFTQVDSSLIVHQPHFCTELFAPEVYRLAAVMP